MCISLIIRVGRSGILGFAISLVVTILVAIDIFFLTIVTATLIDLLGGAK